MLKIRTLARVVATASVLLFSACGVDEGATDGGHHSLGIARFTTDDVAERTSVVGLDAAGNVVARVDITHGVFAVSPRFADDFLTPEIDGRRLEVSVGDTRMAWETEGYEPVMSLPAVQQPKLAALMQDDVVRQALAQWAIGFQPSKVVGAELTGGETAYQPESGWYTPYNANGSDLTYATNVTNLGSFLYNGTVSTTPNLCGGPGQAADQAGRVTNTYNSVNQWSIIQLCDYSYPFGGTGWEAQKTCPLSGPTSGSRPSECGSGSGACKGCPTIWNMNDTYLGAKKIRDMAVVDTYEYGYPLTGAVYIDW